MSHKFNTSIKRVLAHEGGYVNDKDDSGGATNFGISLRFYKANIDSNATKQTIKDLTKEQAKKIYKDHFWIKAYDQILDEQIASDVFDFAVNAGPKQSHRSLQRALNAVGEKVSEDGVLGPLTLAAVNRADQGALWGALRATRGEFYRRLAERKPSQQKFLRGWLRRAYS